ncbi:hypothetical protein FE257_006784 [Aspergillus nanangensis]|uniref:Uncharacterized protein n=1 Tax=Aspergillus nanangensis TaxID=2582783 RepID=A0AAD4CP53_ASPNN|nr:hypothetical protein FE257_006784 [Aspergillus nanangensis]
MATPSTKQPPNPYTIPMNPEYAYTPRKLRIITIGAGFSGLLIAHKLQHRFPDLQNFVEHKLFEARSDVGGTWLINTYPGVQCDVPAHIYAFPFDPNPEWTRFYASGPEIQEYIQRTVKKWNLDRDLHPSWPDIPGLHDFQGHITHSAAWDHDYDYAGKRIAVIGNGSSGIQITPAMAKLPGTEVVNFIRSPAWVYYRVPPSKHHGNDDDNPNPEYTEAQKQTFRDPEEHRQYRKGIIARTNKNFRLFIKGENNEAAMKFAANQMAEKLNHDPELCKMLIPDFEVGCRRITPGPGYLEAFSKPNCNLTNSAVTKITSNAVHTADGKVFECDVVICATGFDVSHCPRYPIIGQNNLALSTKWASDPESYLSVATANFPNYFIMMGPNCLGGHGSLVESLNWTGDYLVQWIRKIATEDIKYVVPKRAREEAFVRYGDEVHKTMVWTGSCRSWYKRNTVGGRVTALFGGSAVLFRRLIAEVRAEDFDIEYRSANGFRFMGNGFTEWEMEEESDLSWYVELPEIHSMDTAMKE